MIVYAQFLGGPCCGDAVDISGIDPSPEWITSAQCIDGYYEPLDCQPGWMVQPPKVTPEIVTYIWSDIYCV